MKTEARYRSTNTETEIIKLKRLSEVGEECIA
jgi:hypothetical protein